MVDKMLSTYKELKIRFYNSAFWYHIYYKHTKMHKSELREVRERVLERRKELINK